MLLVVTAVSVSGGVVFLFFARGHVQDWARDKNHDASSEIETSIAPEKDTSGSAENNTAGSAENDLIPKKRLLEEKRIENTTSVC